MLILILKICYIIGLILIVANGQILKNNLTIWSHCYLPTYLLAFINNSSHATVLNCNYSCNLLTRLRAPSLAARRLVGWCPF